MKATARLSSRDRRALNQVTHGLLGLEKKYFDYFLKDSALTAPIDCSGGEHDPATYLCLNAVPQSDTALSRDGREISMASLQVEGQVYTPVGSAAGSPGDTGEYFVALVLDTQTKGAQLNSEDVFLNPGADGTLSTRPLRNMTNTMRFKVLTYARGQPQNPACAWNGSAFHWEGTVWGFKFFVDLKGLKCNYQVGTTTGVVGTIETNSLHIIAFASHLDYAPKLNYHARLRFYG